MSRNEARDGLLDALPVLATVAPFAALAALTARALGLGAFVLARRLGG